MFKITAGLFGLAFLASSAHAEPPHAKISPLSSGALLLNGQPSDLASIEAELKRLQTKGTVWYYRNNPQAERAPRQWQSSNWSFSTACRSRFPANRIFSITSTPMVVLGRASASAVELR